MPKSIFMGIMVSKKKSFFVGRGVVEAKKVFTGGGYGAKFNTFGLGKVERRCFMRAIFLLSLSLLFSLGCPEAGLSELNKSNSPEEGTKDSPISTNNPNNPNNPDDPNDPRPSVPQGTPPGVPWPPFHEIPEQTGRTPNPTNRNSDVDCDGIPDWEEERFGTDPLKRDTDGDGIWDGIEVGRISSPDPLCKYAFPKNLLPPDWTTSPIRQDSDCDGIADGDEDKNKNGREDPGETDPNNPDTDGDGLWDGLEKGVRKGMIWLGGQQVPVKADAYGVAEALFCNQKYPNRRYAAAEADCPAAFRRETDPLNPDSDGDGIPDGVEDSNHNACFEPNRFEDENASPKRGMFYTGPGAVGETDPKDENSPPEKDKELLVNACHPDKLPKIHEQRHEAAATALGLPKGFQYVDIQDGTTRGFMGADGTNNVAFAAWKHPNIHPNIVNSLATLRQLAVSQARNIANNQTLEPNIPAAFPSWDSTQPNVYSSSFTVAGNATSPAARVNAIVSTLLNTTSRLPLVGDAKTPQYVLAQYVLRDNGEVIVVVAVAGSHDSLNGDKGYFTLKDVAGSAALARYFDQTVLQCENSEVSRRKVDYLFVVDDSASMETSQRGLGRAGDAMVAALQASTLDWRVAMVTSSYNQAAETQGLNRGVLRGFTKSLELFKAWLTLNTATCSAVVACRNPWAGTEMTCRNNLGSNNGCWVGQSGSGTESMLGSARLALVDLNGKNLNNDAFRLRSDAEIEVIILSDTEDQTTGMYTASQGIGNDWVNMTPAQIAALDPPLENINNFHKFFDGEETSVPHGNTTIKVSPIRPGHKIPVHAIVCDGATRCNESEAHPNQMTRLRAVSQGRSFEIGSIRSDASIDETMRRIVNRTISKAGVKTQKPFIGASLHVAMDNPANDNPAGALCDKTNVPRSRKDGFDYDFREQTVSFFGNCRPPAGQKSKVAFSYLTWMPSSRLPCEDDPRFINDASAHWCRGPFACENDTCVCLPMCGVCPSSTPLCDMEACVCNSESTIG